MGTARGEPAKPRATASDSPQDQERLDDAVREWSASSYEVLRRIGAGGMGVVYEAVDRRSGQHVALKTLLEFDPAGLYRFKQEFRTIADVHHRNLVRLYELVVAESGPVFFTMELVDGVDFLAHVRDTAPPRGDPTPTTDRTLRDGGPAGRRGAPRQAETEGAVALVNHQKLRPALRQLVEGLQALHEAGKLHRDIKPSNVLVTPERRVVLLDFGVTTDLPRVGFAGANELAGDIVGTPKYMSPEQAAGEPASAASDLYSVGAMLYEVLVGRSPFEGTAIDIMKRKTMLAPLSPSDCVGGVPGDLNDLCNGLLQIDPAKRPSSGDVLRMLGSSRRMRSDGPTRGPITKLVGRESESDALRVALERAQTGQAVTVRVSGEAGMGKSSLVRTFVDELITDGQTNVLCGRAYERESVPYKAVDGVVDALSQLLVDLDDEGPDAVAPRNLRALARLFPVLRRVPSIDKQVDPPDEDPQAERRRAFRGLRDCLTLLARRRPLVLFIDDAQWGDTDSVALLVELMRPPHAPGLLLLMTSREEDAETSPFLTEMAASWPSEVLEIHVGRLANAEAHALALSLLGSSADDPERVARAIVREAHGSPLLIQELVRSHRNDIGPAGKTLVAVTLERMVARRLDALPPTVRNLAETVAVAGRPLPVQILADASGLTSDVAEAFALLDSKGLARLDFRNEREVAEPVHDRIRETVVAQILPSMLREHHDRLASLLSATHGADLEALAIHLLGAGKHMEAAAAAERAAAEAASKLAFDQSARLMRMALEATPEVGADAQRLRISLARTLVQAGRASAAADEFGAAARLATGIDRVELERAAAEQLLMSGRVDDGHLALRRVLDAMGVMVPRSALGAVLLLLIYQLRLRMAGTRVRERDASEVSREDRVRIDTLRSVSAGLAAVDVVLGACMQARHLLAAMEHGDRTQVLQGLGAGMIQLAILGRPESKREKRMTKAAAALAEQIGPEMESYLVQTSGLALYMRGQYREALEKLDIASRAAPGGWGTANARLFAIFSCFFLGKHREVAGRGPRLLREVEERGDLYTAVSLRATIMVDIALADDDPEQARRHVNDAMSRWTQTGFHAQHWYAMWSEALIDLYRGDVAGARATLERDAPKLRRSFLLRAQMVRGMTAYLRGCCAIASIEAQPSLRAQHVAEARRIARQLRNETAAWGTPFATIIRAAAENASGDRETAVRSLRDALRSTEGAHLGPQAWATRYQLGKALGGDEGRDHIVQAEGAMREEGVRSPERTANLLLPGRWS